jgi:DNA-binding CsgD family transcriptional regulator
MSPLQRRASGNNRDALPSQLLSLFAANNLDGLIDAAFPLLRSVVTCDFSSAFYRGAGAGLLKERDSKGRESTPAFMRRYVELTPALPFAMANPGVKILGTRTLLTGIAELRKTPFYREVMQPQGWRHAVALCFWGEQPEQAPIFVVSVYRDGTQKDFSKAEIDRITRIHPFIDCAVNRLREREAAVTVGDGLAIAIGDGTPGFAILDRNLRLVQANQVARELCAEWASAADGTAPASSPGAWSLPPMLETGCRELHRDWQRLLAADPNAAGVRRNRPVVHPRVAGLTVSITLICPTTAALAEPAFVLEFDRRVHGIRLGPPDESAPVLKGLTAAERAVATVLLDGLSNQEIADRLGKTVDAVKFLLHRIYEKTGIPSRAALVAVLRVRPTTSRTSRRRKRRSR